MLALKYTFAVLLTYAVYCFTTGDLFIRNNLVYTCCATFVYAFNVINLTKHNIIAISSTTLALLMVFDTSCLLDYDDYISAMMYYRCIEYDTVRVLATYSWALGGLIACVVVGLMRITKPTRQIRASDNAIDVIRHGL
ncbi:hypothetical protein F-VV10_0040 [Faustovirus]|nr:hypothetical protein F-VV10_0040 [Faustovirus]